MTKTNKPTDAEAAAFATLHPGSRPAEIDPGHRALRMRDMARSVEMNALGERLAETEDRLAMERKRVVSLEFALSERFRELAGLTRLLLETKDATCEANRRLEEERHRRGEVEGRLRAASERLEDLPKLTRRLGAAKEAHLQATRLLEEERRQHGLLRAQLQAVESSTSWRLTRPIRGLGDALKAVRRRLGG